MLESILNIWISNKMSKDMSRDTIFIVEYYFYKTVNKFMALLYHIAHYITHYKSQAQWKKRTRPFDFSLTCPLFH